VFVVMTVVLSFPWSRKENRVQLKAKTETDSKKGGAVSQRGRAVSRNYSNDFCWELFFRLKLLCSNHQIVFPKCFNSNE
jgi:hypothetical protein